MSEPILTTEGLTMRYGRSMLALDSMSLCVRRGDIYGLIGPNGAGKTTTFKIVATILKQTAGRVEIGGLEVGKKAYTRSIRQMIGYMPDNFGVYEDMTVDEYLNFFAAAYDIVGAKREKLVTDVLDLVDLGGKREVLIETMSRGMQQRLGIARVLIHDPQLLILDEPASGLDPRARIEIRSLLLELQKMGKTILISSHILSDLGEICNRVGIIEKGRLLIDGNLRDVLRSVKPSSIVLLRVDDRDAAERILKPLSCVQSIEEQGGTLAVSVTPGFMDVWQISDALIRGGVRLSYIEQETESLERAFLELTQGVVS